MNIYGCIDEWEFDHIMESLFPYVLDCIITKNALDINDIDIFA